MFHKQKNGFSGMIISYIFKFILLIIIVITLKVYIDHAFGGHIDINQFETNLIYHRILLSNPGIFYYNNKLGLIKPGIVDLDYFNSDDFIKNLNKSLSLEDYFAVKFELYNSTQLLAKKYLHKELYDYLLPLSVAKGAGRSIKERHNLYVLIKRDDKLEMGKLIITVLKYNVIR